MSDIGVLVVFGDLYLWAVLPDSYYYAKKYVVDGTGYSLLVFDSTEVSTKQINKLIDFVLDAGLDYELHDDVIPWEG